MVGDEGAIALGKALRENRTLEALNIGHNRIENAGGLFLAQSVGHYKLSPHELFERRKLIRELEMRQKETLQRKKRASKGKERKMKEDGKSSSEIEDFEALIERLQPAEIDGVIYSMGNRFLKRINISDNYIQDFQVREAFEDAMKVNEILVQVVDSGNPFQKDLSDQ